MVNNNKSGFSLAEALISMLIISMFFMATSKIMTQKQPDEIIMHTHGFCACYKQGSTLKYACSNNGSPVQTRNMPAGTASCTVNLPRNATMYTIASINGTKVIEKQQFINDSVRLTPPNGLVVDGTDITDEFKTGENCLEFTYNEYKNLLTAIEEKATFINSTTNALYISW